MNVQEFGRHAGELNALPQVEDGYVHRTGALGESGDASKAGLRIVGPCHQSALQIDDEQRGIRHVRQPIHQLRQCITSRVGQALTLLRASIAASDDDAWTS